MERLVAFFTEQIPLALFFLLIFIVQLKIIRTLQSHTSMIMYYGKQIEELRKIVSAGSGPRRQPELSTDESGLYEVLGD